jgi:uncharacterized membrane protein
MEHCPNCTHEISDTTTFCPQCGCRVGSHASSQVLAHAPQDEALQLWEYFKAGWQLARQYPAGFLGFVFVYLLSVAILSLIPYVGGGILAVLAPPLYMGNFVVCAKLIHRQQPHLADFFSGFHFFLPLLVVGLMATVLTIVGAVLLIIPGLYLAVSYMFAKELVIDRRLDFWEALELSRRTVHRHWVGFFGFLLLLGLLNLVGAMLFGVGLLFTIPMTFGAITAAFADIFGWQSDYSGKVPRLLQS